MLDLPPCPCGAHAWITDGAGYGTRFERDGFTHCDRCKRSARLLRSPITIFYVGMDYAWLRETVEPMLEERRRAIGVALLAEWGGMFASINAMFDLPADTCVLDVPFEKSEPWQHEVDRRVRGLRERVNAREEFRRAPVPSSVPEGVVCYVRQPEGWERV